jgi:hypothetical protein
MLGQAILMTLTGKNPTGVIKEVGIFDSKRLSERRNLERVGQTRPCEASLAGFCNMFIPINTSTAQASSVGRQKL